LSLHRVARQLTRRLLTRRDPFILSIFSQMTLLFLAMVIAIPAAPIGSDMAE